MGALAAAAGLLLVLPAFANDAPTNGLIAYAGGQGGTFGSNWEIYHANPDGSGDTPVLQPNGDFFFIEPTWAPDGNQFAYVRGIYGTPVSTNDGIWVANADGSNRTKIVSGSRAFRPYWSKDGSTIWFYVNQNDAAPGIYRVDPDGSNLARITEEAVDQQPAPSPDGSKVVFVGGVPDGWGLYVMDADGGNRTQIVDDTGFSFSTFDSPDWSPDGSAITFGVSTGFEEGADCSTFLPTDLYQVAPDGTGLTELTNTSGWDGANEYHPRYSPDGTKIVYLADRWTCANGSRTYLARQVFTMNADGSGTPTQISEFSDIVENAVDVPSWQPCKTATTARCVFETPSTPPNVQAFAADGSAFVSWDIPNDDGGAVITAYQVTASPGGATATTDGYSVNVEVPGLSNGTAYTFSITATNGVGAGPSAGTGAVTPTPGASPAGPAGVEGFVAYNRSSAIRMVNADGAQNVAIGVSGFEPTWAPDGNSILYVRNSRMYTADPDGSNEWLVSNHPDATADGARWSPDGTKILHWDWLNGMWILDPQTFIPTQINEVQTAMNGAWSPDGTKIAYTAGVPSGWGIYTMNADGTNQTKLVGTMDDFGPLPRTTWGTNSGVDWSPDGEWIVFGVSNPFLDPPLGIQCLSSQLNEDIWMVRPDGTNPHKLTNTTSWYGPFETDPRFTPDGSAIVMSARTTECVGSQAVQNPSEIQLINLNGVGISPLTDDAYWDYNPAMQPCGSQTNQCGSEPPPPTTTTTTTTTTMAPPPNAMKCQGVTATIQGDAGNNMIEGTPFDDVIHGGDGNDEINGNGGDDIICGGNGDDVLIGADGDDTLLGGPGADEMFGEAGNDLIRGQQGDDVSYGGSGDDRIQDGPGTDELYGDQGKDKMWGGIGIDSLNGGDGNDQLHGGRDNDTLIGENGTDRIWGDSGDDTAYGNTQSDFLYGGIGVDTLYGGDGNDRLFGWTGDDFLYGEAGRDQLRGQDGDDLVDGGSGGDFCSAETVWLNCEIPI